MIRLPLRRSIAKAVKPYISTSRTRGALVQIERTYELLRNTAAGGRAQSSYPGSTIPNGCNHGKRQSSVRRLPLWPELHARARIVD